MKRTCTYLFTAVCLALTCMCYIIVKWDNVIADKTVQVYIKPWKSAARGEDTAEYKRLLFGVELDEIKLASYRERKSFSFLKEYRNPCWLERLSPRYMDEYENCTFHHLCADMFKKLRPVYEQRLRTLRKPWRLRCLPYFYLAGITKSGTTDFFQALLNHPQLHGSCIKEPNYWNRRRYPHGVTASKSFRINHSSFSNYSALFDYSAHVINTKGGREVQLLGDGSSFLFWEDNGWPSHPRNKGLTEPRYTTAMALHTAQPQAKIIVLLRDPANRLYSHFAMRTNAKSTPRKFQQLVDDAVELYNECMKRDSIRACLYNVTLFQRVYPITIRASLYSEHLTEWLKVFPLKQIYVIKSEDYYKNRSKILEGVFKFLDIPDVKNVTKTHLQRAPPVFQRHYSPMLPQTRKLLDDFFKPFNRRLEEILHRRFW